MAKEFFKDLPDTSTPLSAARINGLLDGEESVGSIVVEDIKSKNLFDKNSVIENYYLSYTDGTPTWDSNMAYSDFIEVEPNIDYTMSLDTASILCIHFYDSNKNWLNYELVNDNVSTSLSKKAPATAKYVRLCFGKVKKDEIQFEKGPVATNYSKHIDFSEAINIITNQECAINEYYNGKRVYVKEIPFGSLPNATIKGIECLNSNYKVIRAEGISYQGNYSLILPSKDVELKMDNGWMNVTTNTNLSAYEETYIRIYYTKN